MTNLFKNEEELEDLKYKPLADRMRPRTIDDFVGQEHLLGKNKLLSEIIAHDKLVSLILWGPPGCGKTTLARLIYMNVNVNFVKFSAVLAGVAEVRKITAEAQKMLNFSGKRTVLFVDEIHRFNKMQQDAFLPVVENGTIILIGATTENPSFEIITPLLSRCRVLRLQPLTEDDIKTIIEQVLNNEEFGFGGYDLEIDDKAFELLITFSGGDARIALNALEIAASLTKHITTEIIEQSLQKKALGYDKSGDAHYDTISAFIKSMRGSDPDAAIHYLARMLRSGENPRFIARRLIVFASEDIGNADPVALMLANNAAYAVEFVGPPECHINLAHATTYLACAEKSNAACASLGAAMRDLDEITPDPIPLHLRNAPTKLMKDFDYSKGYKYPHDFPDHWIPEYYLPENMRDKIYYNPSSQGREKIIKQRIEKLRQIRENSLESTEQTEDDEN